MGGESGADERAGSPAPGFLEAKIHATGVALISGERCTAVEAGHRAWHRACHRFGAMTPTGLPSGPETMRRDPPTLLGGAGRGRRRVRCALWYFRSAWTGGRGDVDAIGTLQGIWKDLSEWPKISGQCFKCDAL